MKNNFYYVRRNRKYNNEYYYYDYYGNYKRSHKQGVNIPKKFLSLLKRRWSSPSVLSNSILLTVPLGKFCFTEKIDGLHKYLLIFNKNVYDVTNNKELKSIEKIDNNKFPNMNFSGECIIETEYYNNYYYIFDLYYINGEDYSEKNIYERIGAIKQYLNELGPSFKIKNYNEIPDINFLLEYIKKDKSPEGNDIDGVILQRKDKPFFQESYKEFYAFKLKPLHLNTIDFLLKYNDKYEYFCLYLKGNYKSDYYDNFKKLPKDKCIFKINNINSGINGKKVHLGENEKVLIYFDSPFYPNLGILKIDKNWNKNNYNNRAIKLIDELIEKMERNPHMFNNKIVELSLTDDKKWVPLKLREDKALPNSYRVGLNNISIIFDPIKPIESIYFQNKNNLSISEDDQDIIHKINQIYRKYIVENYIQKYGKHSSVIDLCGGRGADEFNLYSNGVSNFFVIDCDTTALKRYFDRTYKINNKEYIPLIDKNYNNFTSCRNYITLNFLNYKLDKDYEQIKKDLDLRYEFNGQVDIVIMNFAIHYLCDEEEKIIQLCKFVDSVLKNDGIFIITYFDGDEIIKYKDNNTSKIGPFRIEIIKDNNNINLAKMPLPTIKAGNNIYKEEPLVHKKTIALLEKYFVLQDEYYAYDKCKKYVDTINNYERFIDYYKLVKVGIFMKISLNNQ